MKIYQLETELWLPRPRVEVFGFFADPANLERLTPGWLRFETITKTPRVITEGVRLDYRLRIHGLPIKWQSKITAWDPPHRFIDQQTKGPYRLWVHEHTFFAHEGGTLVCDNVRYSVFGGLLVNKFLVAPDLDRIFKYRHKVLQAMFNHVNQTARQGVF
jgi:ligand-binding SRPBCC domain-containing protein